MCRGSGGCTGTYTADAKAYLRYDCLSGTLYVLVLGVYPIYEGGTGEEHYVKIDNKMKINEEGTGTFAWIDREPDGIYEGWEGSAALEPGNYTIQIHTLVDDGSPQTADTGDEWLILCCSSITIVKDTICVAPSCINDTGDFGYDFLHVGNPPAVEFWLDDPAMDDGDGYTNSKTFDDLLEGTYEVTEDVRPHTRWYIQNIVCNEGADVQYLGAANNTDDFEPGDDTVLIVKGDCDRVVCTFVNEDPGTTDVGIASLAASSGAGGLAALLGMAGLLGTAAAGLRAKRRS
jgi:hypothetical protein